MIVGTFEDVIEIFKQYEPQQIRIADDPKRLMFGWKIEEPDLLVEARFAEAKARWPKAVFELSMTDEGREKLRDLIYEKAWGLK